MKRHRQRVGEHLTRYEKVERVLACGEIRSTVMLRSGVQVDLRVVPQASYGAAPHYFTGTKAHNIAIRTLGVKRGLKINEYGAFRGARRIAGRTEEEAFAQVRLPYTEPELREDRGERRLPEHSEFESHLIEGGAHAVIASHLERTAELLMWVPGIEQTRPVSALGCGSE